MVSLLALGYFESESLSGGMIIVGFGVQTEQPHLILYFSENLVGRSWAFGTKVGHVA